MTVGISVTPLPLSAVIRTQDQQWTLVLLLLLLSLQIQIVCSTAAAAAAAEKQNTGCLAWWNARKVLTLVSVVGGGHQLEKYIVLPPLLSIKLESTWRQVERSKWGRRSESVVIYSYGMLFFSASLLLLDPLSIYIYIPSRRRRSYEEEHIDFSWLRPLRPLWL